MKVLFVTDTYNPHVNGIYHFVQRLATLLQQRGHKISVMVPSANMQRSQIDIDGIDVYGVPCLAVPNYPNLRFPVPFFHRSNVGQLLDSLKPDIIHIQDHFSLAKEVVRANRHVGIPIIGTNHFMPENTTFSMPFLERGKQLENGIWHFLGAVEGQDMTAASNISKNASKVLVSGFNKQMDKLMWSGFSKVFNQLKMVTAPTKRNMQLTQSMLGMDVMHISNGVDLEVFCPNGDNGLITEKYSIPEMPVLLCMSNFDADEHFQLLIHAVAVVAGIINICLVIAGERPAKASLKRLIEKLGIENRVVFVGMVPEDDLPGLYRTAHCFITLGGVELQEIAFASTMEAMACGLPVIAVETGALNELVRDGKNGYLCKKGDLGTMARSIYKIFEKNELRQKMSQMSLKYIQSHDIQKTVGIYEIVYEESLVE